MIIQRGIKFEIAGDKEEACRHVLVRFKAEGRNLHFEDFEDSQGNFGWK